jgi:hypothetical protein
MCAAKCDVLAANFTKQMPAKDILKAALEKKLESCG